MVRLLDIFENWFLRKIWTDFLTSNTRGRQSEAYFRIFLHKNEKCDIYGNTRIQNFHFGGGEISALERLASEDVENSWDFFFKKDK